MSKSKSRRKNRENRYRPGYSYVAHRELARINSIVNEPIIRVIDRRDRFNRLLNIHNHLVRKRNNQIFLEVHAPRRAARKKRHDAIRRAVGTEMYSRIHDCKREFSKLLSWRSSRGGGKSRSPRELRKNKEAFMKRDC